MQRKQFVDLNNVVRSVSTGTAPKQAQLTESFETEQTFIPEELVNSITEVISEAERKLNTTFTAEEVAHSTHYIIEQARSASLIEAIENYVGFELNENEIQYVFSTLNEALG